MTTFSLQKALASESYAQKCWQDYYYGGNTMKIDADSIEKINNNYKGIIQNWKAEKSRLQHKVRAMAVVDRWKRGGKSKNVGKRK